MNYDNIIANVKNYYINDSCFFYKKPLILKEYCITKITSVYGNYVIENNIY